jgi:formiminotetrahydrofolate cyclodeaminase
VGLEEFEGWLDSLASSSATPGGGAVAALSASMGASLICMVCSLTIGKPKYAAYEEQMSCALARAQDARHTAAALADDDARAFETVMDAYRLPRATDAEKTARSAAIQVALVGAAAVPLRIAEIAAGVIGLAREILEGANVNVLSDVAVAASTARAALESSLVNVDINLAGLTDEQQRHALAQDAGRHAQALQHADAVVREVRQRIAG